MEFLNSEYVRGLLSVAAQVSLTEKLIVVGIVWAVMGGKISGLKKELQNGIVTHSILFDNHLKAIENKFDAGIKEMKEMRETISKDLQVNSKRLEAVENEVKDVKNRVIKLET